MQYDRHEPAGTVGEDLRDTGYRLRIDDAVAYDSQPPWLFGDQHVAVRKEHHGPRSYDPLDGRYAHPSLLRSIDDERRRRQRPDGHRRLRWVLRWSTRHQ